MSLPSNGPISIGQILAEMGRSPNSTANLLDLSVDWLLYTKKQKFNKNDNISLSLWRGESWQPPIIVTPADQLTILPSLYDGTNEPTTVTVTVTSNRSWTVTEKTGGSSTTLNKTSGNKNGSFNVSFSLNNSESRSGEIEVKAGTVKKTFYWSQSGPYIAGDGSGSGGSSGGSGGGAGGGFDDGSGEGGNGGNNGGPIDDNPTIGEGFQ